MPGTGSLADKRSHTIWCPVSLPDERAGAPMASGHGQLFRLAKPPAGRSCFGRSYDAVRWAGVSDHGTQICMVLDIYANRYGTTRRR